MAMSEKIGAVIRGSLVTMARDIRRPAVTVLFQVGYRQMGGEIHNANSHL